MTVSRRSVVLASVAVPIAAAHVFYARPAAAAGSASRLFFTPTNLATARAYIAGNVLPNAWNTLQNAAAAAQKKALNDFSNTTDPTRAWQRYVGWSMSNLAAAYLLGGNTAYRDTAIQLALTAGTYSPWGGSNSITDGDLNASDLLFGMAMTLDWLGAEMTSANLNQIVAIIQQHGAHLSSYASGIGGTPAWWSNDYMNNHSWANITGLLAAGLALQPYASTQAQTFVSAALGVWKSTFADLMPDGASQESPSYWEFTAESVLKFHYLQSEVLNTPTSSPWLENAAKYRIATALPSGAWSPSQTLVNQADASLTSWFGPEYQLRRFAALNRDGHAQQLAAQIEAAGLVNPVSPWLNFIWYDPTVPAPTTDLPTLLFFDDMQTVVDRSDWSGSESLVYMRSGPPLGEQALARADPFETGIAHTHEDVNHITLFGAGQFLLRDDGYATRKLTAQHNTLLVNGVGQMFEGQSVEWSYSPSYPVPSPQPTLKVIYTSPIADYWVGHGSACYVPSLGLIRFNRHVVFVKPDILVIIDYLATAAKADFTLLWHSGEPFVQVGTSQSFVATYNSTALRATIVLPDGGSTALGTREFYVSVSPTPLVVPELAVTVSAASAQAGVLFAWGAHSGAGLVTLTRMSGTVWVIETSDQTISVDMKGSITLS
jgi:hypothetical protein